MELTDAQQAEIKAIVSGALEEKMAPIEAKFDTERSNLQKKHGEWSGEQGTARTEFATAITEARGLMKKTLDETMPTVLEPYLKKDQVAPKTEETSADIRKELEAQGKWEDVKKHVKALPKKDQDDLEDETALVTYLKLELGQPKGTSFFDDETPSGEESPADTAKRIFNLATHKKPVGKFNYQKNSTQTPSKRGLVTVGRGLRTERKPE